jgi:predicted lipid-binding transport protein (Tim44 family)
MLRSLFARRTTVAIAGLALAAFVVSTVDARPGRGGSIGSRGERTYAAPPPTATAPRPTQGMDRSIAPQQRPAAPAGPAAAQQQRPGMFGGGMMGAFAMGFLGAGLFGLLAGTGFLAGLGSLAGMLGFLLQLALIAAIVWLVVRFVRARREAPAAAAGATAYARGAAAPAGPAPAAGPNALGAAAVARMPAPIRPSDTVGIAAEDYDAFERLLGDIQLAYGRSDIPAIRTRATPEVAAYFEQELADIAARGLAPRISDVKLLQGDLAEAWREGPTDYATVAMRYALVDQLVERASGRVVEGAATAVEATELWTFRRGSETGRRWVLSAIQQTA